MNWIMLKQIVQHAQRKHTPYFCMCTCKRTSSSTHTYRHACTCKRLTSLIFQDDYFFWFNMLQHGGRFPAPKGFTPDLQWQKLQTANFAELRQVLNLLNKNDIVWIQSNWKKNHFKWCESLIWITFLNKIYSADSYANYRKKSASLDYFRQRLNHILFDIYWFLENYLIHMFWIGRIFRGKKF